MIYFSRTCSTVFLFCLITLLPAVPITSHADNSILLLSLPAYIQPSGKSSSIWKPEPGTSWQWQLSGTIDTTFDVQMYDIDLVDTPVETIATLHSANRTVICYMSAGSWEEYRPDADQYPAEILGNTLDGWPDEKWVDYRQIDILGPILEERMDLAVSKGCDGIEPDNIDGYTNNSGFNLTAADQLQFNRWLADKAHLRGLSIGLKNDIDQVSELVPFFDWALNEECFQFNECDQLLPFVQMGKAVFGVEYQGNTSVFCPEANSNDFDWLKKNLDLDAWRQSCR